MDAINLNKSANINTKNNINAKNNTNLKNNINLSYERDTVSFGSSNAETKKDNSSTFDKFFSNAYTQIAAFGVGIVGTASAIRSGHAIKQVEKTLVATLDSVGEVVKGPALKLADDVRKIATVDGMTGLLNKRVHLSSMNRALLHSQKTGESLIVGMADVDYFKSINDVLGHDVGDKFIAATGKAINEALKDHPNVKACRFGGEEFTIIMQGSTKKDSMQIMKKVLDTIKNSPTFKETFPEYLKKIDEDLAKFEPINASISDIFRALRNGSKTTAETQALSSKITKLLSEGLQDLSKPEVKKDVQTYIEHFTQRPSDTSNFNSDFHLKDTKVDLNYVINLFNKKEEVSSLTKWKKHVTDNNNMFTVSGGVSAEYTGKNSKEFAVDDLKELSSSFIKQADAALYAVKQNGRNGLADFK